MWNPNLFYMYLPPENWARVRSVIEKDNKEG